MDLDIVKQIANNWAKENIKLNTLEELDKDAKFITGDLRFDSRVYHFEQESGIALDFSTEGGPYLIKGYEIVDEQKCAWFVLRWG